MANTSSQTKRKKKPPAPKRNKIALPESYEARTWDEKLFPALMPWWSEIIGGFILLFSFLALLALPAWTPSGYMGWVTTLARQLFGWGAYALFISLGLVGAWLLFRQAEFQIRIRPNFIIAIELLLILGLPLTHILTQATFQDAYGGMAGGLMGWALSEPLVTMIGPFLTILFYFLLLVVAVSYLQRWTWNNIIRGLIYTSGRLRYWSEEIVNIQDQPVRVIRDLPNERHAIHRPHLDQLIQPHQPQHQPAILRPKPQAETRRVALPPIHLLDQGDRTDLSQEAIEQNIAIIEQTLYDFGLVGQVIEVRTGPAITQYGVEPGYIVRHDANGEVVKNQKVRVSQIANLRSDFALALAVPRLRIEAPVPGRGIVGIEVPNPQASMVRLRDLVEAPAFKRVGKPLAVALGEDVAGTPLAIDLAKMPHLLIAGTTGSGKSVCMKALITCLIANNTPDTLRLIMVDPKRVEMIRFNGLPHLLGPAEIEGERIIGVLRWVVAEMDRRYAAFAEINARQLSSYNKKAEKMGHKPMPNLVVFIDELADLMVQFSAETERTLCRLAQMARATGIHLVVATQRPSTDVITGLIKANFPARISFAVASSTDSRVILDTTGADQLLGNGDMLFLGSDASSPKRVQGCFVSDEEIDRLVDYWQGQYADQEKAKPPWDSLLARMKVIEDTDDEIEKAIALCQKYDNISTSLIQRRLRVGFPRAARIMETLFEMGLVEDPKSGGKTRKTYVSKEDEDPLGTFIDDQQ